MSGKENMLKVLLSILVFFNFKSACSYDVFNCSSKNPSYSLKSNTLTFLQTPNFPRRITANTYTIPCNAQINSTDHIWIAMLNGQTNSISFYGSQNISNVFQKNQYSSNSEILTYTTFPGSLFVKLDEKFTEDSWTAFQAAIVSFSIDTTDQCPLSTQTFDFNANPEIIVPVVSEWRNDGTPYISKFCNWVFTLGTSQQLKVVVKKIKPSSDFILSLYENGNIVKNFTDAVNDLTTPGLYFTGSTFNLTFSNQWSNTSDSNFFLLISAFTPSNISIPSGCLPPSIIGSATIFSNIDYNSGYQPYQHCENNFTIPANHEVSVVISKPYYEACCDILSIKYTIFAKILTI